MVWNKHMPDQTDPGTNSEEQLHTEELIAEMKNGEFHACEELFELYKRGNQQAYDALILEAKCENEAVIQLILQKIKEKDDASADILIDSKEKLIFSRCMLFFSNRQQVEDMTQETFIKAVAKLKKGEYQFQGAGSFARWLEKIAINLCKSEYKKMRAQKRGGGYTITSIEDEPTDIPGNKPSPEDIMMYGERKARLKMLVNQLPEDLRDTVVLIDYGSLSYTEAAQILDVSEGTVKSRRHRAIKKLGEIVEKMSEEERAVFLIKKNNSEGGGARNGSEEKHL